ncbi:unnamed protein product [Lactuca saligna]|uniref:Glabrous enhancer-binding protein-like DBD domain-containing protein n=1 Tax=Lactuca saligna TaxID=75948 RepID=A0AA36EAK7_LACSI|nr:unnamed protein product [Lactuca saligna]
MGSDEEDHITAVYGEEDLDEEDDDESEEEDHTLPNQHVDEDDVDMIDDEEDDEEEDDSMSSAAGEVTIAVAGIPNVPTTVDATPTTATTTTTSIVRSDAIVEVKKPMPLDDSRRLFQRLWTDEDEIELLQGFLDYTTQRGTNNSSHHHHDTAAFYDQIKGKLQLDFNKNQLVEKLRRLKKKYRNVLGKISIGKEYVFKSPHDQATFDLSCKIWNGAAATPVSIPVTADGGGIDDDEPHNTNLIFNLNENNANDIADPNSSEKKVPRPRKRSKTTAVKIEENSNQQQHYGQAVGAGASNPQNPAVSNLVEETVKSCLLPLFKELVNNSPNGARASLRGIELGGMNMNHFGGSMNFPIGDMTDDKWRKQHILELEVYSKRLELMQDQIKSRLEELRSMGSS